MYLPPSKGVSGGPFISPRNFKKELSTSSTFTPAVSAWKEHSSHTIVYTKLSRQYVPSIGSIIVDYQC